MALFQRKLFWSYPEMFGKKKEAPNIKCKVCGYELTEEEQKDRAKSIALHIKYNHYDEENSLTKWALDHIN